MITKALTIYALIGLARQAFSDEPYWLAAVAYSLLAVSGALSVHEQHKRK